MNDRVSASPEITLWNPQGSEETGATVMGVSLTTGLFLDQRTAELYETMKRQMQGVFLELAKSASLESFRAYIEKHPISGIPDFIASYKRWRNAHLELATGIPEYNKTIWEKRFGISKKADFEAVFGIKFINKVRKPILGKNEWVPSQEYFTQSGQIDIMTLEKRLGKSYDVVHVFIPDGQENQFQFTLKDEGKKKTIIFHSASGKHIPLSDLVQSVEFISKLKFAKGNTKKIIMEDKRVPFFVEIDFSNVVVGWSPQSDTLYQSLQRTDDTLYEQGSLLPEST
jgi:hypothetical protein